MFFRSPCDVFGTKLNSRRQKMSSATLSCKVSENIISKFSVQPFELWSRVRRKRPRKPRIHHFGREPSGSPRQNFSIPIFCLGIFQLSFLWEIIVTASIQSAQSSHHRVEVFGMPTERSVALNLFIALNLWGCLMSVRWWRREASGFVSARGIGRPTTRRPEKLWLLAGPRPTTAISAGIGSSRSTKQKRRLSPKFWRMQRVSTRRATWNRTSPRWWRSRPRPCRRPLTPAGRESSAPAKPWCKYRNKTTGRIWALSWTGNFPVYISFRMKWSSDLFV